MAVEDIEIKLDGQRVDLSPDTPFAATFQANDIGDLSKMKADTTTSLFLPDTPNNHRVMKNAAKIGSDSAIQLGTISASYIARGVPLMTNGRARIQGVKDGGYDINIFGGNFDFFEQIKDKKLIDFDWTTYDYIADAAHFVANYQNNSGICFPVCEYDKAPLVDTSVGVKKQIFISKILPWFFLHTIIEQVILQSGFTFESLGGMFDEERYKKTIIALNPTESTPLFEESAGVSVDVGSWMPDVLAIDLIKSVLYQYGAFISTIDKKIYFIQLNELYKNSSKARKWSDKFDDTVKPAISFEIGYAQNNLFRYPDDSDPDPEFGVFIPSDRIPYNGNIESDNKNLEKEKIEVELPFEAFRFTLTRVQDLLLPTDVREMWFPWFPGLEEDDTGKLIWKPAWGIRVMIIADMNQKDASGNVVNFAFMKDVVNSVLVTPLIRMGYFSEWVFAAGGVSITRQDLRLSWDDLHFDYWNEIEKGMLKNPTKVTALFDLNPVDIQELKRILPTGEHGRSVPVYVKQLNGQYYVNKVSKFIPGEKTQVELIKL